MNIDDLDIPTLIKIARLKLRMTQVEFAEYLNITQSTVSNWEVGKTNPSGKYLRQILKIIDS